MTIIFQEKTLDGCGELRRPFHEGGQQNLGHGTVAGHEHAHAGLDRRHRLVRRGDPALVDLLGWGHGSDVRGCRSLASFFLNLESRRGAAAPRYMSSWI